MQHWTLSLPFQLAIIASNIFKITVSCKNASVNHKNSLKFVHQNITMCDLILLDLVLGGSHYGQNKPETKKIFTVFFFFFLHTKKMVS